MAQKHKTQHLPNACRQHLHLLAILLRLRVTPSVPFPIIACILLATFPSQAYRLFMKTTPKETQDSFLEEGINVWLAVYFEDVYKYAEHTRNKNWVEALKFDSLRVWEVLRVMRLDSAFGVCFDDEVAAKVKWGSEGDWRAGSEAMGRPPWIDGKLGCDVGYVGEEREKLLKRVAKGEMTEELTRRCVSSDEDLFEPSNVRLIVRLRQYSTSTNEFEKGVNVTEQKMHSYWKTFEGQLEEIKMLRGV